MRSKPTFSYFNLLRQVRDCIYEADVQFALGEPTEHVSQRTVVNILTACKPAIRRLTLAPVLSSVKQDWGTPDELFKPLDAYFRFGLDASASAENKLCEAYIDIEQDALAPMTSWLPPEAARREGRCAVWNNPPYNKTKLFLAKACEEAIKHKMGVVNLVANRAGARYWSKTVTSAPENLAGPYQGATAGRDGGWLGNIVPCEEMRQYAWKHLVTTAVNLQGRWKFKGASSTATFASALIIYYGR